MLYKSRMGRSLCQSTRRHVSNTLHAPPFKTEVPRLYPAGGDGGCAAVAADGRRGADAVGDGFPGICKARLTGAG